MLEVDVGWSLEAPGRSVQKASRHPSSHGAALVLGSFLGWRGVGGDWCPWWPGARCQGGSLEAAAGARPRGAGRGGVPPLRRMEPLHAGPAGAGSPPLRRMEPVHAGPAGRGVPSEENGARPRGAGGAGSPCEDIVVGMELGSPVVWCGSLPLK